MAEQANDEKIMANALAPKRASGDAGSMEQHSIPDQLLARDAVAAKKATRSGKTGMRYVQFVPPGGTGT